MRVDVELRLPSPTTGLAAFADAVGSAGISLDGGGMTVVDGVVIAHFLVDDGPGARDALDARGLPGARLNGVALLHLDQETPGQLATCIARFAAAGIALRAQYSDHAGALVLVPEPEHLAAARGLATEWDDPG